MKLNHQRMTRREVATEEPNPLGEAIKKALATSPSLARCCPEDTWQGAVETAAGEKELGAWSYALSRAPSLARWRGLCM
jgi:hypothetical protein